MGETALAPNMLAAHARGTCDHRIPFHRSEVPPTAQASVAVSALTPPSPPTFGVPFLDHLMPFQRRTSVVSVSPPGVVVLTRPTAQTWSVETALTAHRRLSLSEEVVPLGLQTLAHFDPFQ